MSASAVNPPTDPWVRGPVSIRQPSAEPRPFERPAPKPATPGPTDSLVPTSVPASAPTPVPVDRPDPPVPIQEAPAPTVQEASPALLQEGSPTAVLSLPPEIRQAPPPVFKAPPAPAVGISWVGAHGGAGATTFAAALGGTDIGHAWPEVAQGEPGDILLLARTHLAGLQAASKALDSLRTGRHPAGVRLVALVLVADAPGRLPPELWRRVRVLRAAVRTFSVPWIAQWRVGRPAPKAPRSVVELAALIPTRPEATPPPETAARRPA
ncbi:DUF6668 family protein [Streptomyces zaehneri]|uniref:DUF6668 family protein n=1 Tax=Streptomyces zaehneri TaxID=3051180 RepID=UPI0028D780DA|nr:DUF6668 family protein [Streptomyces sp. DSM 40713]